MNLFTVPAARTTDPTPSHAAEAEINATGARARQAAAVLAAIREHPDRTSRELANYCGLDAHEVGKRVSDLCNAGAVVKSGERQCSLGRRLAGVWRAASV